MNDYYVSTDTEAQLIASDMVMGAKLPEPKIYVDENDWDPFEDETLAADMEHIINSKNW